MTLLTQALVFEHYGLRLNMTQLAEALGITKGALNNQISAGTCPVATYLDMGKRWCDYREVARHIDEVREAVAGARSGGDKSRPPT